jgi:hypothetical protein
VKHNDPVDPKIDMLVSALYGELSDAERGEFEALLASDAALRAEWEELSGTRSMLGAWELDERVPSFIVVDPGPARRRPAADGWWSRLSERFRGAFTFGGWAVAGAAAAVMVLAFGGLNVQKTADGFAVSFGKSSDTTPVETAQTESPVRVPVDRAGGALNGGTNADGTLQQVSNGTTPYLTRDEFDQYTAGMLQMMASYLSDYRSRRDQEIGAALRTLYGEINQRQSLQYEDLLSKIDSMHPTGGTSGMFDPTDLGVSRSDSIRSFRQRPDGVEDKRNE